MAQIKPEVSETVSYKGTKEKSPMSLVNEICRSNNINPQYRLIEETGEDHNKIFSVSLKLGKEEYTASADSIRKAQQAAASVALSRTNFIPSQRKTNRLTTPLTPTVELNVLAMKRGETVHYQVYEPPLPVHMPLYAAFGPATIYDFRGMYNQRYCYSWELYRATVTVGDKKFSGDGINAQLARRAAAEHALQVMRELALPENRLNKKTGSDDSNGKSSISMVYELALKRDLQVKFEIVCESGPSHLPSFVTKCIVGEYTCEGQGNGKKMSKRMAAERMVEFLKSLPPRPEKNPTENSAKSVKKRVMPRRKEFHRNKDKTKQSKANKNREVNGSEENSGAQNSEATEETNSNTGPSHRSNSQINIHPISRLIQLQQARKQKEPEFNEVLPPASARKNRGFAIECVIRNSRNPISANGNISNPLKTTGVGPSKKVAKKLAAESMLSLLGYSSTKCNSEIRDDNQCSQSILKPDENVKKSEYVSDSLKVKKVKFIDGPSENRAFCSKKQSYIQMNKQSTNKCGRQLVPGLLLMSSLETQETKTSESSLDKQVCKDRDKDVHGKKLVLSSTENEEGFLELASKIAKELLESSVSKTAASLLESNNCKKSSTGECRLVRPTQQLEYLANVFGLEVHFADFPRSNKNEYLSVVTITANPPQVCHGLGGNTDASRDSAALQVLKSLASFEQNASFHNSN